MKKSLVALGMLMSAVAADAAVLVFTAPEYNGTGVYGTATVTTWNIALPIGHVITAANFTSAFGNSVVNSSAEGFVTVGGITVGLCPGDGNPCWNGPGEPIVYDFDTSEFSALVGSVDLAYTQTGCCVIRLAESTLTITTAGIPEPATWGLMIAGFGLVGVAARTRRRVAIQA
jgi:hypothetical protein